MRFGSFLPVGNRLLKYAASALRPKNAVMAKNLDFDQLEKKKKWAYLLHSSDFIKIKKIVTETFFPSNEFHFFWSLC